MNKKIKFVLKNLKSDCLLVSNAINVYYLTGYDGFSKEEREAFLLITKKGNYIFTDGRYSEAVVKSIADFKFIEVSAQNGYFDRLREIINKMGIKSLMVSEDDLSLKEFIQFRKLAKINSDDNIIEKLRGVKTAEEIKNIKSAAKLGDLGFKYILTQIKTGVTEAQIAKKIEIFFLENNARVSFLPIVAFGSNSSIPHHMPTNKKLTKNQIVLLDFGVRVNGYCSDMTRTVFFGLANPKFKRMYKTVLNAQQKAIVQIKKLLILGKTINASEIDKTARNYIISQNFPSIPHSLGHGIGLNVHEDPRLSQSSKSILSIGNVFSIEPGIYIPSFGGIRIEDLVVLTNKGPLLISNANREIIEVDA